jgi:bisphosphoglycerate-dependent phosphoglycerate mutase
VLPESVLKAGSMAVLAKVYIIRHGETEENKLGIIQGQLDTDLNLEGMRQVEVAAKGLKDIPFDVAYTSDLTRALKVWVPQAIVFWLIKIFYRLLRQS